MNHQVEQGKGASGGTPDGSPQSVRDRRQRAELAGMDALNDATKYSYTVQKAVNGAITAATQVTLTPTVIRAFRRAWVRTPEGVPGTRTVAGLVAALTEMGFEVAPVQHAGADGSCPDYGSRLDPCLPGCASGICDLAHRQVEQAKGTSGGTPDGSPR